MAVVLKDRVRESTTTTGTGTVTLAGAESGYQPFSVLGNGAETYYAIVGGAQWEVGIGTYTLSGTTLSRDTVLESSNAGALVNFSAGSKSVFVTYPAEKSAYLNPDGTSNQFLTQTAADARYLLEANNLSDLTNTSTARSNLGLGSLATLSAVGAAQITDNSVGAAELNVSGNGTTGQVLASDGDGSFSWADQSSGGGAGTAIVMALVFG